MTIGSTGRVRIPRAPSAAEERFSWLLRHEGLAVATREHQFHPKRKWRFDFAFLEPKVAVEIEGGAWNNGRHTRGTGFTADMEKYNAAALLGWRVFRFTPDMVNNGAAIETLRQALQA